MKFAQTANTQLKVFPKAAALVFIDGMDGVERSNIIYILDPHPIEGPLKSPLSVPVPICLSGGLSISLAFFSGMAH